MSPHSSLPHGGAVGAEEEVDFEDEIPDPHRFSVGSESSVDFEQETLPDFDQTADWRQELDHVFAVRKGVESQVQSLVHKVDQTRAHMIQAAFQHLKRREQHVVTMAHLERKAAQLVLSRQNSASNLELNGHTMRFSQDHDHVEPATEEAEAKYLEAAIRASLSQLALAEKTPLTSAPAAYSLPQPGTPDSADKDALARILEYCSGGGAAARVAMGQEQGRLVTARARVRQPMSLPIAGGGGGGQPLSAASIHEAFSLTFEPVAEADARRAPQSVVSDSSRNSASVDIWSGKEGTSRLDRLFQGGGSESGGDGARHGKGWAGLEESEPAPAAPEKIEAISNVWQGDTGNRKYWGLTLDAAASTPEVDMDSDEGWMDADRGSDGSESDGGKGTQAAADLGAVGAIPMSPDSAPPPPVSARPGFEDSGEVTEKAEEAVAGWILPVSEDVAGFGEDDLPSASGESETDSLPLPDSIAGSAGPGNRNVVLQGHNTALKGDVSTASSVAATSDMAGGMQFGGQAARP